MNSIKLGTILHMEKGKKPKSQSSTQLDGYLPYVDIKAFEQGIIDSYATTEKSLLCEDGDLLIVCDGSRSGLTGRAIKGVVGSTLSKISADGVTTDFLRYFIQSKYTLLNTQKKGTGTPHLNAEILKLSDLVVPSIPEQERVVARIEELFSELDKAVATLQTTKQQLAVYRQAVQKEAFEGKLTKNWRNSASIRLSDYVATSIAKRDSIAETHKTKKLRYSFPEKLLLCAIPKDWQFAQIGDVAWSIKDGPHYSPEYVEEGVPFITGGNVRPSGVDFASAKKISKELHEELNRRCKPEKGDLLYTKGGTTGIARVNTYDFPFSVWVHVAVIKFVDTIVPEYFQHVLNSPFCYQQSQEYTHGVGNQDLGLTRMINIVFPICSIEEQKQIVYELESRLSVCESIEQTVDTALAQADAMRQSILKQAFEGGFQ